MRGSKILDIKVAKKRRPNILLNQLKHYVNLGRLGASSRNIYMHTDKSHKKEFKAQISQGISMIQGEQAIH